MVIGLLNIQHEKYLCEDFMYGKQHRYPFEKQGDWRDRKPLELIHSDLCNLMQTLSLGGSRYFLSLIDDFSRKIWVYFLKNKFEVFEKFQNFKVMVEESGHRMKTLIKYNGGEFKLNEFMNYCRVPSYFSRLISRVDIIRNLAPQFWAEAINYANYIQNRTPHSAVQGVTLEEAWSKRKPRVDHFTVFGSPAWAHIPDEKRKTMEKKSEPCIFVGYCEDVKSYRLLVPGTQEVIFRRNIQIEERSLACMPSSSTSSLPSTSTSKFSSFDEDRTSVSDPSDTRRTRLETQESHLACLATDLDPHTFKQASGKPEWDGAMNKEYHSLLKNDTWDLVPLPKGRNIVRCKWVYRTKYATDGNVEKYKARLVAKGFSQFE
eukprot:Gb_22659 [translate_table: standard]